MSPPVIQVQELEFAYEKTLILHQVNFKVAKGEFVGIFGPNGGGKTTLLKLLMGFLKPKKGHIHLFGKPPKMVLSKIGYVPQLKGFDKKFPISVLEVVLMGALSKARWWGGFPHVEKERALDSLKRVGLYKKRDQPFGTLSGGEAQRVLIARALTSQPEILLLDEPTASIDREAEQMIYQLLEELKKSITILMVTHDLQALVGQVDKMICINREATSYHPREVCEHFALGLYHPPIRS